MLKFAAVCVAALGLLGCQPTSSSPSAESPSDHPAAIGDPQTPAASPPSEAPLFPLCGDPATASDKGTLEPDAEPIESTFLQDKETHRLSLEVDAGEYVHLIVEQQQVDLVLGLVDAQGQSLVRVDSLYFDRGTEEILWKSPEDASLTLLVCGPRSAPENGRYSARLAARRPATDTDEQVAEAFLIFHTAEAKRRQGTQSSQRQALPLYDEAATRWNDLGRTQEEAFTYYEKGRVLTSLSDDLHHATDVIEKALGLFRVTGDEFLEANALHRLASLQARLGEADRSVTFYYEALAIRQRIGHRSGEIRTLMGLGSNLFDRGELAESRDLFERALQISREVKGETLEASILHRLAVHHELLGDDALALERFERALQLRQRLGNPNNTANAHAQVGRLLKSFDRRDESIEHLQKALDLYRSVDNSTGLMATLNSLGLAELERENYDISRSYLLPALELARTKHSNVVHSTHLIYGWLLAKETRCTEALPEFEKAAQGFDKANRVMSSILAYESLAICHQRLENYHEALPEIEKAIALIEFMRERALSMSWKSRFFADRRVTYDTKVDILVAIAERDDSEAHLRLALETSERAKARTLLDAIEAKAQNVDSPESAVFREEARLLEEQIYDNEVRRLMDAHTPKSHQEDPRHQRHLGSLLEKYEIVTRQFRFDEFKPREGQTLDLDGMRRELGDDTTLLEFQLGHRQSHLWLLDHSKLLYFRLPHRDELRRLSVAAFRNLSTKARPIQTELLLEQLGEKILAGVLDKIETRRILVVKDGPLLYLPLETLPSSQTAEAPNLPIGRVGDGFEFIGAPSVSVLAQLRRYRPSGPRDSGPPSIAIFADPVFHDEDPRLQEDPVEVRPRLVPEDATRSSRMTPEVTWNRNLERLVYSQKEGEAIEAIAQRSRWKTRLALGFDASKANFRLDSLNRHEILHLATHANFNSKTPELAHLVLSQFDTGGRPVDGYVFAYELYGLDLKAETVVLSACSGALGSEIRGEGLVGLTQGFLHAGASRVLVSLWQVDDRATAELMQRFYLELLENNAEPATALRLAKDHVRRIPGWESPYYWAGFSLQGEWKS